MSRVEMCRCGCESCGDVQVRMCADVEMCRCGDVQVWMCAGVEMCRCGCVEVHVPSGSHLNGRLVGVVDHPQ